MSAERGRSGVGDDTTVIRVPRADTRAKMYAALHDLERERDEAQMQAELRDRDGQRLYNVLARFDRRDGTYASRLVQAAREGWERSHPDMAEAGAWDEFDRLWADR